MTTLIGPDDVKYEYLMVFNHRLVFTMGVAFPCNESGKVNEAKFSKRQKAMWPGRMGKGLLVRRLEAPFIGWMPSNPPKPMEKIK